MPAGEVGEICFAAPQLMIGFWNRPEETAGVLREHARRPTASVSTCTPAISAIMDADGYVFIVDRKKDLIKMSGYQVWPREIEEVLASHPAIAEVGVAGVADDVKGEAVKAWVVLRAGQTADRGGPARLLPREAGAVQSAVADRVPVGAAEDHGRQGAAARASGQRIGSLTAANDPSRDPDELSKAGLQRAAPAGPSVHAPRAAGSDAAGDRARPRGLPAAGCRAMPVWTDRRHFVGIAARSMRQILVERARARGAAEAVGAA